MSDQPPISRRQFTGASLAAGLAVAAGSGGARGGSAAAHEAVVTEVEIKTTAGVCDAALAQPGGQGQWPGVILFVDAFGLRPAMRDMAKRLAQNGYSVLVPNPYYRSAKAPGLPPGFSFSNPQHREQLAALRALLTAEAVTAHPDEWSRYCGGDDKLAGFFTGLVMKATRGQANGKAVAAELRRLRG